MQRLTLRDSFKRGLPTLIGGLVAVVLPQVVMAQAAGGQRATRADLIALKATLDSQAASGLKGAELLAARQRSSAVATRLENGDFKVGDRFLLSIQQGDLRVDTASVRDSMWVAIPTLPDLSVAGVLRSELDSKLEAHISRFLRNATVRATVLTRVAILGAVQSPGFYYASPDKPIGDLVMVAGGPAANADIRKVEVLRGKSVILRAKDSAPALERGRTLEQLDIQSGDEVRVATKRQVNWGSIIRLAFIGMGTFFGFLQFLQWYYSRQDQ
jgi:protein involved in polysaccharide export with SLBB domain